MNNSDIISANEKIADELLIELEGIYRTRYWRNDPKKSTRVKEIQELLAELYRKEREAAAELASTKALKQKAIKEEEKMEDYKKELERSLLRAAIIAEAAWVKLGKPMGTLSAKLNHLKVTGSLDSETEEELVIERKVNVVAVPNNAEEAEMMQKIGYAWLKHNAPDRLVETGLTHKDIPYAYEIEDSIVGMHSKRVLNKPWESAEAQAIFDMAKDKGLRIVPLFLCNSSSPYRGKLELSANKRRFKVADRTLGGFSLEKDGTYTAWIDTTRFQNSELYDLRSEDLRYLADVLDVLNGEKKDECNTD